MGIFNDFIKPTAVLVIICLVVTTALAYTESVTTPIIDENERIAAEIARAEVLPEADGFTLFEGILPEGVTEAYTANNGVGAVVTTTAKGYGGDVVMMSGIGSDGKIVAVKVLSHAETPGIGTNVINDEYLGGISGADSSLSTVDAVSGATRSSNAVKDNLTLAFAGYDAIMGGNG